MPTEPSDEVVKKAIAKLDTIFSKEDAFERRGPAIEQFAENFERFLKRIEELFHKAGLFEPRQPSIENVRRSRFGFSMILIGIIALIGGIYPFPTDPFNRAFLFIAGLFCALVGVWNIHTANRDLKRSDESSPDS